MPPPAAVPQWTSDGPGRWRLSDRPGGMWLLCTAIVVLGGAGLAAEVGALTSGFSGAAVLATSICAVAVAGGIAGIQQSPLSRVLADTGARTLTITRRGLLRQEVRIPFDDVRDVRLVTDRDVDGDEVVQPVLALHDGSRVPLSLLWQRDRDAVTRLTESLNEWLRT